MVDVNATELFIVDVNQTELLHWSTVDVWHQLSTSIFTDVFITPNISPLLLKTWFWHFIFSTWTTIEKIYHTCPMTYSAMTCEKFWFVNLQTGTSGNRSSSKNFKIESTPAQVLWKKENNLSTFFFFLMLLPATVIFLFLLGSCYFVVIMNFVTGCYLFLLHIHH